MHLVNRSACVDHFELLWASRGGGQERHSENYVQVSRLGQPLVNEVVIPRGVKDTFSSERDDRFALARLMIRSSTGVEDVARWLDRSGAPPPRAGERARTKAWRAGRRGRALVTRRAGATPGWPVTPA